MSGYQILIVVVSLTATFMDGYDLIVVSFVAPRIADEFDLSASLLGLILAAASAGQVVGAIVAGWIADRAGRRPTIIAGLVVIALGMLLAAVAPEPNVLIAGRFITGLGAGGLIGSVGIVLNEYSNRRRYGLIMGLLVASVSIGGVLGGVISAPILEAWGWRAAFLFGAIVTLLMAAVALAAIPESLEFLVERSTPRRQAQAGRILRRMGRDENVTPKIPARRTDAPARVKLSGHALALALIATGGMALAQLSFPFLVLWTPQLVASSGAPEMAVTAGIAISVGGVIGSLFFGGLTRWVPVGTLAAISFALGGVAMLILGVTLGSPGLTLAIAAVGSLLIYAGMAGYYAMVPAMFPVETRASAFGVVLSIGRLVGVASPILGGWLISSGAHLVTVGVVFAVPLLAAGVLTLILQSRSRAWNRVGQDLLDPNGADRGTRRVKFPASNR